LLYSCNIFNVLPVKCLYANGQVSTPFELFQGEKPKISHFLVFGCPITARKWITTQSRCGKQTQRGIRGIFVGFSSSQKGYLFYSPASRQLYILGDNTFDETSSSTIGATWKLRQDNLVLRPISTDPPTTATTIESTGGVIDNLQLAGAGVEEGSFHETLDDAVFTVAAHERSDNPPVLADANDDDEEPRTESTKMMTTVSLKQIMTPTWSMILMTRGL
jgi:hypothetical protein